jgi:Zn-dependent protease with chaperone function
MRWPMPSGWIWWADVTGPTAPLVRARWFDGRSSQARAVLVGFAPAPSGRRGPDVLLHPVSGAATSGLQRVAFKDIAWPEAWSARRVQRTLLVDMGAQGSLEVDDGAQWHAALAAAGGRVSLVQRMQTRWTVLAAVVGVAVVALGLFYRYGTPWAATQLTRQVPLGWETDLAGRALQEMDARYLQPSALPAERQADLRQRFAALVQQVPAGLQRYPGYVPRWSLQFRAGMGANAFALPGGTVVVTDGLVQRATREGLDDTALLGVLAHEMGHVVHRHTTRMVVEQGVLNIGLGLALGDASAIVSTGSSLLTGLAYRRNHEAEADCFSVALMRQAGLPTAPMARLLVAISGADAGGVAGPAGAPPRKPADAGGAWTTLLSSHPDTAGRAERLRQNDSGGC